MHSGDDYSSDCPQVLIMVPLRLDSTRLPKKILTPIQSKPLYEHVLGRLVKVFGKLPKIKIVAAIDHEPLAASIHRQFPQVEIVLTQAKLASGTDRIYAAVQNLRVKWNDFNDSVKGIINVQGDMPFVGGQAIRDLASYMISTEDQFDMLTLVQDWPADYDYKDPSHVKALVNKVGEAIYFSRFPIPLSRDENIKERCPLHVGVYGYSLSAITRFCIQEPVWPEKAEGLEQLRALFLGMKIKTFKVKAGAGESFRGIDTAEDVSWAQSFS